VATTEKESEMDPVRPDNPDAELTTTLGTSLGGESVPIDRPAGLDSRRSPREPLPGEETHLGPGPKVMAADTLEGDEIVDPSGEKLGTLEHIMVDVPSGRVAYGVLSFGGFMGMGDKLFAIPWRALSIDPENHRFVLNASKETLKDAPGFDKDRWPSMADERWATQVHAYYHVTPYWGA
jgi:sporulation protein YlmC with PRC-barrel domain